MPGKWAERLTQQKYEEQGYDVIHTGVPDLLLLKDGKIEFVEVKTPKDKLQDSQKRAIKILEKHGFGVRVERIKNPKVSKRFISMREQREIVRRYKDDDLTLAEIYDLIVRSQNWKGLDLFTRLLMSFYNDLNAEMGTPISEAWFNKRLS